MDFLLTFFRTFCSLTEFEFRMSESLQSFLLLMNVICVTLLETRGTIDFTELELALGFYKRGTTEVVSNIALWEKLEGFGTLVRIGERITFTNFFKVLVNSIRHPQLKYINSVSFFDGSFTFCNIMRLLLSLKMPSGIDRLCPLSVYALTL